jgi:hypothetical protein
LRIEDFYLFMAPKFTFFNDDLAFGDAKLFCQIFGQMRIRLAINGGAVMATLIRRHAVQQYYRGWLSAEYTAVKPARRRRCLLHS